MAHVPPRPALLLDIGCPEMDPRLEASLDADGVIADGGLILDWLATAQPGAEICYALEFLPKKAAGPRLLREHAAAGRVLLYQRRVMASACDAPGLCVYFATRTKVPMPLDGTLEDAATLRTRAVRERAMLMAVIADCAQRGLPMPSNRDLAVMANLRGGDRVSHLLAALRRDGRVAVTPVPEAPGRVVTIIASGKSTSLLSARRAG